MNNLFRDKYKTKIGVAQRKVKQAGLAGLSPTRFVGLDANVTLPLVEGIPGQQIARLLPSQMRNVEENFLAALQPRVHNTFGSGVGESDIFTKFRRTQKSHSKS